MCAERLCRWVTLALVLATLDSARGTDATSPPEGPQDRGAPQKGRLSLQNAGEWGRARPGTARAYAVRAPRGPAWSRGVARDEPGKVPPSARRPHVLGGGAVRWPGVTCCGPSGCGGVNKGCARIGREGVALRCRDPQHSGRSLSRSLAPPSSSSDPRPQKLLFPDGRSRAESAAPPAPKATTSQNFGGETSRLENFPPCARGCLREWGGGGPLGVQSRPLEGGGQPARNGATAPSARRRSAPSCRAGHRAGSLPGSWERKPSAAPRSLARLCAPFTRGPEWLQCVRRVPFRDAPREGERVAGRPGTRAPARTACVRAGPRAAPPNTFTRNGWHPAHPPAPPCELARPFLAPLAALSPRAELRVLRKRQP